MPAEDALSAVLSEFARTMVTDFPIQGILDHLVLRIVNVLPITAAGVTLISPGSDPRYVAASNPSALRFEQLQTELGEGPCIATYQTGEAVTVPDLRVEDRFPRFAPRALAAGLVAVFTFPLRKGDTQLGALDLYRGSLMPCSGGAERAACWRFCSPIWTSSSWSTIRMDTSSSFSGRTLPPIRGQGDHGPDRRRHRSALRDLRD